MIKKIWPNRQTSNFIWRVVATLYSFKIKKYEVFDLPAALCLCFFSDGTRWKHALLLWIFDNHATGCNIFDENRDFEESSIVFFNNLKSNKKFYRQLFLNDKNLVQQANNNLLPSKGIIGIKLSPRILYSLNRPVWKWISFGEWEWFCYPNKNDLSFLR